ncbi:unnamed protein product, partial [Oppiella nova]
MNGNDFVLAINDMKHVFSGGNNSEGQLGRRTKRRNEKNILFVTNNDTLYGMGGNNKGCLGFGHNTEVKTPQIIPQLCNQRIQRFINGYDFVLAINDMNHVCSWGHNDCGQLGRDWGPKDHYSQPEEISYLNNKYIKHICCGFQQSLALTAGGQVYVWGENNLGQIANYDRHSIYPRPRIIFVVSKGPDSMNTYMPSKKSSFEDEVLKLIQNIPDDNNMDTLPTKQKHTDHNSKKNIIFITNNDSAYGLGGNASGCLGLGHNDEVKTPQIITELCRKRIQKIINGNTFVLAINNRNHVFSWGHNNRGQLGREMTEFGDYLKPRNISYMNDKNIQHIYCGTQHSLALTTDGQVYGWGDNRWGQIGQGHKSDGRWSPVLLKFANNYKIQSIFCFYVNSFAVTADGLVFSWGFSDVHQLGHNTAYDILSPKLIPHLRDIIAISTTYSDDNCFTHYESLFIELSAIGSGGFGTVFKVKHRFDEQIYAVKRIEFKKSTDEYMKGILMEVKNLRKLNPDFVVQYITSWPESKHLYIQMEFCSQNLRNILDIKPKVFDREFGEAMSSYEYFISCEIFRQILESVQYLHELNPQIIHRDLKPDNILIDGNGRNGRFVKLCDFGLATDHDKNINYKTYKKHTSGVGTMRYMAPEVLQGYKYDHKSDVYCLAIIGSESYSQSDDILNAPVVKLKRILVSMASTPAFSQRPDCSQVLQEYSE